MINREECLVAVIGFFVGRAVCFSMNPLAAAFWLAAQVEGLAGMWLYLTMGIGMLTRTGIAGLVSFTVYSFLVMIAVRAYKDRRKGMEISYLDWLRLCILGAFSLFAAQLFVWSIALDQMNVVSLFGGGTLKYLWRNNRNSILAMLQLGLESVLTASIAYLLLAGLSKTERQRILVGSADRKGFLAGCVLAAIVLYGLPMGMYTTFAVAESVCYLIILCVAYSYGVLESTAVAAFCGAVLAYRLDDFSVLGLVTLFGMAAGLLREMGRVGIFSGMALIVLIVYFGVADTTLATNSVKGLVTAGVIFLFMPRSFLVRKRFDEEASYELIQEQMGQSMRECIRDFSGGFFQLQNSILKLPKPAAGFSDKEVSTMYLQMKENVCDQCEGRYRCFNVDAKGTFLAAKSIFQALDTKGGISREDIPIEFAQVCDNQEAFMIGANVSFERAKSNRIMQQKMAECRETLARQIGDVALLMNAFSGELMEECKRDEDHELLVQLRLRTYHVKVRRVLRLRRQDKPDMVYLIAKCQDGNMMTTREMSHHLTDVYETAFRPVDGSRAVVTKSYEVYAFLEDTTYEMAKGVCRVPYKGKVSGDNFSFLELPSGMFVAMLSDGMGTGEEAYEKSAMLIDLLEEFMTAGFPEQMALSLANSVLALNYSETSFSTLDMMLVNLYDATCQLIKVGASTTFIKRDKQVEMIASSSLPAGVFSVMDYEVSEYALKEGDMIIFVSDGVMDSILVEEKDVYLKEMIAAMETQNVQKVADSIVHKIKEMAPNRVKDDMTVMAFSLWKKC